MAAVQATSPTELYPQLLKPVNGSNGQTVSKTTADKYADAERYVVWDRDDPVKIRYGESGLEASPSIMIQSMLESTVKSYPNTKALAYKENGQWHHVTYQQYYDIVQATAKSFIKIGLEPTNGVGILGFNAKEWHFSNLGCIYAGGLSTGIYTTNTPDAVAFVANSARCNVIVVENQAQLNKVLQVWDQIPALKAVVQYKGTPETDRENVYTWDSFIKLGEGVPDQELQDRRNDQYVNKCATLIYTSGTTGQPKGVMLSHDNITYTCRAIGECTRVVVSSERIITYLPLSHIAAQLLDIYLPLCYACTVYFAQPDALKGTLSETMKEVQPTIFFGVPRVFEKIEDRVRSVVKGTSGLLKKFAGWSIGVGQRSAQAMERGSEPPFSAKIANVFYKKVRAAAGLTKAKYIYCGAAPLSNESHKFLASVGLPVNEVYGMSESTGACTMTIWQPHSKHWRMHSAGYKIPGVNYDLLNKDEKGHGEIAMYGRNTFMGYLGEEQKTVDTFDPDFKLKSGDVGYNAQGFLFISGRIKELLITAGGENVAPVPIEDTVKEELPVISNCMLVGDKQKFLSMLISLRVVVDMETMRPTDEFAPETKEWLSSIGSEATKVGDIVDNKDEKVTKAVNEAIVRANKRSESNAKKVQKFVFIPEDFSISGGELGPTLKVKRPVVVDKYANLIEGMYKN